MQPTDYLDLRAVVRNGGEQGLLGLAFAPDYATSGRVFVNFINLQTDTVIARFTRSASDPLRADPATRFDLRWPDGQRFITQPFANHNGGNLAFGPDGYLYIGMGDGGSGNDPLHHAQNPQSLLGKMLRIDVSVPDSDPEGYNVPADQPVRRPAGRPRPRSGASACAIRGGGASTTRRAAARARWSSATSARTPGRRSTTSRPAAAAATTAGATARARTRTSRACRRSRSRSSIRSSSTAAASASRSPAASSIAAPRSALPRAAATSSPTSSPAASGRCAHDRAGHGRGDGQRPRRAHGRPRRRRARPVELRRRRRRRAVRRELHRHGVSAVQRHAGHAGAADAPGRGIGPAAAARHAADGRRRAARRDGRAFPGRHAPRHDARRRPARRRSGRDRGGSRVVGIAVDVAAGYRRRRPRGSRRGG